MVGDDASKLRSYLELSYPMENGIVKNWDDMEHLWNYTFYDKLKIDPTESKIVLTEPPLNPVANRKRLVEEMFERYNFDSCYVGMLNLICLILILDLIFFFFFKRYTSIFNFICSWFDDRYCNGYW